jgi:hypothetical protein
MEDFDIKKPFEINCSLKVLALFQKKTLCSRIDCHTYVKLLIMVAMVLPIKKAILFLSMYLFF